MLFRSGSVAAADVVVSLAHSAVSTHPPTHPPRTPHVSPTTPASDIVPSCTAFTSLRFLSLSCSLSLPAGSELVNEKFRNSLETASHENERALALASYTERARASERTTALSSPAAFLSRALSLPFSPPPAPTPLFYPCARFPFFLFPFISFLDALPLARSALYARNNVTLFKPSRALQ